MTPPPMIAMSKLFAVTFLSYVSLMLNAKTWRTFRCFHTDVFPVSVFSSRKGSAISLVFSFDPADDPKK